MGRLSGGALLAGILLVLVASVLGGPARAPAATDLATPVHTAPPELAADRVLGRADAPATLEIWEDFQCPACAQFTRTVEPQLIDRFVAPGTLKIVFHDFAFIGDESIDAAVGARCAGNEGRFWPFHDLLFANQRGENRGAFSRDRLHAIAEVAGLDGAAFEACLSDDAPRQATLHETADGRRLGVQATPTLMVGGETFEGVPSWDRLVAAIRAAGG